MAQLIDITKVAVSPKNFMARVRIAPGGPLTTDQDLIGTTHIYNLMPEICEHTCLGDAGSTFKDAMGATEIAHLLEHVSIELMARTGIAADITCGRTWEVEGEPRTYDIQLDCPDDVLVASALSSGAWILQWAYSGGSDPKPDVDAIVAGIRQLAETAPLAEPEESAAPEAGARTAEPVEQAETESVEQATAPEELEPSVEPETENESGAAESEIATAEDAEVTTVAGAKFDDSADGAADKD